MQKLLNKVQGDKVIWLIVVLLAVFSTLAVYSSTGTLAFRYKGGNTEYYLFKHFGLMAIGIFLMYLAHLPNYKMYSRIAQVLVWVSIPLLLFTLLFGTDLNDARRWITVPMVNLSFQTSDLAKLALIMYVARYLGRHQDEIKDFRTGFLPVVLVIGIVCVLIAPADLSSAVILGTTCMLLLFIGRVKVLHLIGTGMLGLAAVAFVITLAFAFPDVGRLNTWKNRVESFTQGGEPQYQVVQSKIAIAQGGMLGKGPGNSSQRNFLPHPYSDFIYSIIIEEYGLIGGAILILLYLALLYRSVRIIVKSPGAFGALLAAGLAFSLVIQALVNMGVAVNLLPVTGLTLPLVSMGGTSLWFTSIAIGIILSVSRQVEAEAQKAQATTAEVAIDQVVPTSKFQPA